MIALFLAACPEWHAFGAMSSSAQAFIDSTMAFWRNLPSQHNVPPVLHGGRDAKGESTEPIEPWSHTVAHSMFSLDVTELLLFGLHKTPTSRFGNR